MTFGMSLHDKLPHYVRLMRIDKPIGTLLLLWPTLWALWVAAGGLPPLHILVIFVIGTFLMRSAGCVINDYADRDIDGHVERTLDRPLATGRVRAGEALWLAAGLSAVAFLLVLPLGSLVIWLSIPALFLAGSYPFTKRFFALPQAYLGLAFGFSIPMGFAAVLGEVPALAWVMLLANTFWTIAYDTEYAMVDRPDDLRLGIRTAAITFGRYDVAAVMLCYGAAVVLLGVVGGMIGAGFVYYLSLAAASVIAGYHYTLIRGRARAGCFKAFRHNNWFGAVVFAGIFFDLLQCAA